MFRPRPEQNGIPMILLNRKLTSYIMDAGASVFIDAMKLHCNHQQQTTNFGSDCIQFKWEWGTQQSVLRRGYEYNTLQKTRIIQSDTASVLQLLMGFFWWIGVIIPFPKELRRPMLHDEKDAGMDFAAFMHACIQI